MDTRKPFPEIRDLPDPQSSSYYGAAMSKALIIAEKPSVAADIARALGGFVRHGDYFENDDYVLSSAVGHLVEIAAPEQYDVKRGKWSFTHLPVIPPHFDLKPIEKTHDRLKQLTKLIKRKDVTSLINACDAGREGELIFRLIVQYAKAKQPMQRLWLQSMTPNAIREGFANLRQGDELNGLADAARSRAEADWLVGINGTRAMTAFNSRDGGFYLTTVGRVQTPTLAVVVEREEKIRRFVPRDYFEVKATFGAKAGQYEGKWFDRNFKKSDDPEHKADRFWTREDAEAIVAACEGKPGTVTEESKPSTQIAPALFDLTTLQREANGRFGFSAKTTLALAQALYEKHKVLTYPRTDSRALPEDYLGTVRQTLGQLSESGVHGEFARTILEKDWVKPNKRVFDNSKISDHFAWWCAASWPSSTRRPNTWSPPASPPWPVTPSRPKGACWSTPAGWPSTVVTPAVAMAPATWCPSNPTKRCRPTRSPCRPTRPGRRRATPRPRCSRPWKAPASWSTTTSCVRPWPARAWARQPPAPPSSRG